METYTQYYNEFDFLPRCNDDTIPTLGINCTDCHAIGVPQGAPVDSDGIPTSTSYQVFTFMLNNAYSSCPSDLNFDGKVDGVDLAILLGRWGLDDLLADLDGNNVVNGSDISLLLAAWGDCSPSEGLSSGDDRDGTPLDDTVAVRRYLDTFSNE